MTEDGIKNYKISFLQGKESLINEDINLESVIDKIKSKINDLSNVKHINFLLGAGASADAIPAMKDLLGIIEVSLSSAEFKQSVTKVAEGEDSENLCKKIIALFESLKSSTSDNLEDILGILYSHKTYLSGIEDADLATDILIKRIETEIYTQINIDLTTDKSAIALSQYKLLYQKLSLRNKDLARVNIFTTNNDLLSETALDFLNINYNNGFGGGLTKVFNPARFNYTFSRKVDSNLEKYEPLENVVYLYKLHGSISWIEVSNNLFFNIQETSVKPGDSRPDQTVLIYPTPLKQNKSLGSPYADLIREFQKKLQLAHSVLFIIGYSFSDEHINNVIYQALASNASISIVVFGNYSASPLFNTNDRRIYKIYGHIAGESESENEKIHYFNYIVNELLPDLDDNKDSNLLKSFIDQVKTFSKSDKE